MVIVLTCCALLVVFTSVIHYEVLRLLSYGLPIVRIAARARLIIVIVAAFVSHAIQMVLYGGAYYALIHVFALGILRGGVNSSLATCLYFSAETFTSLGFGDIVPSGPVRMLAGAEALNGLLLIGWSASFAYLAMERFWARPEGEDAMNASSRGAHVRDLR
jgi:hypothetical protein